MKKLTLIALALVSTMAVSAEVAIEREQLGSGTPPVGAASGHEMAFDVADGVFHAPQYMPFYPTAAPIWPRVVQVPCKKTADGMVCGGYKWTPKMGRGEYLFIVPAMETKVQPPYQTMVITREVVREVPKEVIIYREVPVKKKDQ